MTKATYDSGNERDMAMLAYNTYKDSVGGHAYDGQPLPAFEHMPLKITTAWLAAARAVSSAVRNQEIHNG